MAKVKHVKLYTKDDLSSWIFAEYTDARSGVDVPVTLDKHFVGTSSRGLPWECLVARAILRAAANDPNLFPHPVKPGAYVIGSTAYILVRHPKSGNQTVRCVRYRHNFTRKLRKFDKFTKRTFLKHFGDKGLIIRLTKPPIDTRRTHGERNAVRSREDDSRARILRGAERRAHDAGIVAPIASV